MLDFILKWIVLVRVLKDKKDTNLEVMNKSIKSGH